MRIGLQLLLSYILATIFICLFIFRVLFNEIKPTAESVTKMMLTDISLVLTKMIEKEVKQLMRTKNISAERALYLMNINLYYNKVFSQDNLFNFQVLNNQKQVIYSSNFYTLKNSQYNTINDLASISVSSPILNQNKQIGEIVLSKSINSILDLVGYLKTKVVIYSLLLILGLFLLSGFFIFLINHSLMKLINYSKALTDDKTAKRPKFLAPELVQLGRALEDMKDKLEGKKYIENYIHTLTHELKSPLSSIVAAADIMQDYLENSSFDADEVTKIQTQQRYLKNIENQTIRMQEMIEKMLQLARLDSRSGISFELTSINDLIEEAIDNTIDEARNKNILLSAPEVKMSQSFVDKFLLKQALINVISNALDFTANHGEILVSTSIVKNQYIIQIIDSGVGIPDYAIDKVLNKFYSLPRPNRGKSSGLGLSFVQEVASLHNGKLTIQNRNDDQTGVIVTFKFQIEHSMPKI